MYLFLFKGLFFGEMGKLGKKARKFAKKNLQSVLKRRRKLKSLFKKKAAKSELFLFYVADSCFHCQ